MVDGGEVKMAIMMMMRMMMVRRRMIRMMEMMMGLGGYWERRTENRGSGILARTDIVGKYDAGSDACDDDNHHDCTIDDDEEEQDFDDFAYEVALKPIQLLS